MNTLLIVVIGLVCIAGIVVNLVLQLKKPQVLDNRDDVKQLGELKKELENERAEKNKLSGGNKQLFAEHERLKAEFKSLTKECDQLRSTVTKYETKREQNDRTQQQMIDKQEAAVNALKEERQRVIKEEEEMRMRAEEERDRIWADHENAVIASLSELCKMPQLQFKSFSNTQLPDEFDGKLKPDFLIEFLGQYVIFDAKASKAESLQTYINDAVKTTAEKVRKNAKIYPHVFLVVPTEAIGELKKLIYAKDEFYFYVISREALAPILASLKRISTYELAETLDPQKRENIINMLAELTAHINYRNAHEILLARLGTDTIERMEQMDPELATEVEQKKNEKKMSSLSLSDIKRLASSIGEQNITMQKMAAPKAAVKKKHIEEAAEMIADRLL